MKICPGKTGTLIVDGLLSQSGRSWVKADGHSTKSGKSLGINRSVKVDGPKVPKVRYPNLNLKLP